MSLPGAARLLLRWFAPGDRVEDLLGDLEEVHRARLERHGPGIALLLTNLEAVGMVWTITLSRVRRSRPVPISWIDVKLGFRMLVKYPGLTLVGVLAMSFGICVAAAGFEFYSQVLHPILPFDEGERVVDVALVDRSSQGEEPRLLHELGEWRTGLSTIEELGAAQLFVPNLAVADGPAEPVRAAAMTASGFRMTRVPPFLGRTLIAADESPSSPEVVVLGHDVWRIRFGADPGVIGATVRVGGVDHTVVGVMPPGFAFPYTQELWIPLRVDPAALAPLEGPAVKVFGRIAPGATLEKARSELSAFVARAGTVRPDAYERLFARVLPYAEAASGITGLMDRLRIASVNVFAGLFLVLMCGNVALLVFARAAAREGEIVVRAALGADRRRIVWQLFTEALVLSSLAGLVGVLAAGYALDLVVQSWMGDRPLAFWLHRSLSARTVPYAALLALVSAVMVGVVPALKMTSGKLDPRLRRVTAGGGGLRFGGVWTAVIVLQVATTVAFRWWAGPSGVRPRISEAPILPLHPTSTSRLDCS